MSRCFFLSLCCRNFIYLICLVRQINTEMNNFFSPSCPFVLFKFSLRSLTNYLFTTYTRVSKSLAYSNKQSRLHACENFGMKIYGSLQKTEQEGKEENCNWSPSLA